MGQNLSIGEGKMTGLIQLQTKLVPEVVDLTEKRYSILRTIEFNQPIGRRALSGMLGKSERWVRSELDVLKEQGLIDINPLGMTVTDEGREVLSALRSYIAELKGLKYLEELIRKALGVQSVLIANGDADADKTVLAEMAKLAFEYMKPRIADNSIIAVSGGYSLLALAESSYKIAAKNLTIVPARGGIKADLERQANIVAAKMAQKMECSYHLLHLPDNISMEMLDKMKIDPDIAKAISYIRNADIFVFGLSSLEAISQKRKFTEEEIRQLSDMGVRAEAFGCYFNSEGKVVYKTGSLGIQIEDLKNVDMSVSIGGGKSKAEPMIIVNKGRSNSVVVIDEAAAREIYNILQLQGGN